jgi:hypothetical protein
MVAMAAAIVSGKGAFERLLKKVEGRRRGVVSPRDHKALPVVRANFERSRLTAGDLQKFADALYRAFLPGDGASDEEIEAMITACGLRAVKTPMDAREIVRGLQPGELFPFSLVVDDIWHVTLVWKDAAGAIRLYDSDRLPGTQVFSAGTPEFDRYLSTASAETLGKKFR